MTLGYTARAFVGGILAMGALALVERFVHPGPGGSLVLSLAFWRSLAEGSVAVIAAAEVSRATWHRPLKAPLLAAYPMIAAIGLVFLALYPEMPAYPWWGTEHIWTNKWWFFARHVIWIGATFWVARRFAVEAMAGTDAARRFGVFYLLLFVIGQSIMGFEWIMSLEKPWFSTLFGAYFVVEAFQSGIVIAAIALLVRRDLTRESWRFAQRSVGGLMFGFAIFWAYFYFSQLIVIWYGNLPEEVLYVSKRIGYHTPYWGLARLIFGACWVVPFVVLLGRRPKRNPVLVTAMGLVILAGFLAEKWLMVAPIAEVSTPAFAIDWLVLGGVFVAVMRGGARAIERSAERRLGTKSAVAIAE